MVTITSGKQLEVRLEQVLRYAEDAAQRAQEATSKLYGSDGRPKYASHVEREKLQGIAESYVSETDDLLREAESWRLQAQTQRKLASIDPFVLLTGEELQRANLLLPLAVQVAEVAPLAELAERLTAIAALAELPDKLAWLVAAEKRAAAERPAPGPDATVRPSGDSGRLEFTQALDALRAASVHPKVVEAQELAQALTEAATQVKIAVSKGNPATKRRREMAAAQQAREFARRW